MVYDLSPIKYCLIGYCCNFQPPAFDELLELLTIPETVCNKLKEQSILQISDLLILTEKDIEDLGLSIGQRSRLRAALNAMKD